jgi:hypothetical protein
MEHALQLEAPHIGFETLRVLVDVTRGRFVALAFRKLEKLRRVRYAFGSALDLARVRRQPCPLTSQLLRTLRFGPDGRIFQLTPYLLEALLLEIVLKETPVRTGSALRGL